MTFDQFVQFIEAIAGCAFVVACVSLFGLSMAMDVTAATARGRRAKTAAAADLVAMGGQGIMAHYVARAWRRRKRRMGRQ